MNMINLNELDVVLKSKKSLKSLYDFIDRIIYSDSEIDFYCLNVDVENLKNLKILWESYIRDRDIDIKVSKKRGKHNLKVAFCFIFKGGIHDKYVLQYKKLMKEMIETEFINCKGVYIFNSIKDKTNCVVIISPYSIINGKPMYYNKEDIIYLSNKHVMIKQLAVTNSEI